jgi:triacylglycerol lipase
MNIVLVHGFISTGKIFFYIKKKLEALGHKCFTPTLKPIDAKYGIEDLAIKLKDYIENNLEADSNFVLVGFSMGAIICRYYLQDL